MTSPLLTAIVYSAIVVAASMIGGWLPSVVRFTHQGMQMVLSFVGGMMLGIAVLHLLPHGVLVSGSLDGTMMAMLCGLLFMFFMIRLFHFHQHGTETSAHEDEHAACDHDHSHHHHHEHGSIHGLSWAGVATGLAIHSVIDGVAYGTAIATDAAHHADKTFLGFAVFLAVLFHKPLDALSITSMMRASGWPKSSLGLVNVLFALTCPLGAILAVMNLQQLDPERSRIMGWLLGFCAGVFLCISLSDLLPEVQFHRHDRFKLSAALLFGIAIAFGLRLIEPEHSHQHAPAAAAVESAATDDGQNLSDNSPRAP